MIFFEMQNHDHLLEENWIGTTPVLARNERTFENAAIDAARLLARNVDARIKLSSEFEGQYFNHTYQLKPDRLFHPETSHNLIVNFRRDFNMWKDQQKDCACRGTELYPAVEITVVAPVKQLKSELYQVVPFPKKDAAFTPTGAP